NGVALLSESGQYSTPSFTDGPLLWDHNRVNLRLHAPAVRSVAISDELPVARIPAMISVLDSHNRTLHRGYLLNVTDRRLLDALGTARPSDTTDAPTPTIPTSPAAPSSPAVPANPGRDEWASADQLDHIDAIIRDGGVGRYRTVGSFRMPRSRRVSPDAIPNFLTTLWSKELSITVAVITEGCMQFHRGSLDLVDPAPGALTAASAGATIAIALDSVADCWLVTTHGIHGSTSMLELYDAAGHCVALFTQLGPVGQDLVDEWQQLTASLVS
ncbi:MAG: hypothetical protein JWQ43_3463, partial [Glaciihabitans sp.]|nr:hypothetical protein [Glaciihabitans sp.]